MAMIEDAETQKLIGNLAARLEKVTELKPPQWAQFVKTGVAKQRPPTQENWWWLREASILRKIYLRPGLGVNRLRRVYSDRKNLGHQPEHSRLASGAIIRRAVHQLEAAGFLKAEKNEKGKVTKRVLTEKGLEILRESAK